MSEQPHIENFEIVGCLGQGGMATVWKARQASLDRFVAIKVLAPHFATEPSDIARFCEEARAAGRLKHPGIVQVYDANFKDGSCYFVMELVDGCTVGEWIRRKGRLTEQDALTVAESVAVALDYAATGFNIIHCDIKPENIMIDADGTLKITDLGLARAISSMKTAAAEEILGTPAYMAPEQVRGETDLDGRVDIYALGATLYHMVTGHTLFAGGTVDQIMQNQLAATVPSPSREVTGLSRGFVLMLAQMLAKDRKYRPQDWKTVLTNVRRVRGHHLPAGENPPPGASTLFVGNDGMETVKRQAAQALAEADRREERRSHGIVWLMVGLALVALGAAAWAVLHAPKGPAVTPAPREAPGAAAQQLQEARAYAAAHPNDFDGGRVRLQEVIDTCGDAACADKARDDLARLQLRREQDVQKTREMLDEACRGLIAGGQHDGAARMLEQYRGRNAAETGEWRRQHAAEIRAAAPRTPPPAVTGDAPPAVPPPAVPPAAGLTADKVVHRLTTALLHQGIVEADRTVRSLGTPAAGAAADERVTALHDLIGEAAAIEHDLIETYRKQRDQHVSVPLVQGTVRGTVKSVNGIKVRLTLDDGSERAFTIEDLDVQERLRLLGRNDSAGGTLLKAVWAFHAHAVDRARTLAANLPAPAGALLAAAMAETP